MKNNTGNYNTGHRNSGDYNSGYYNTGHRNSGHYNSGYYNSGDYNSGNYNSGNCNNGDYNSGHWSSGHCNSGNCNSGHCNSGHWNSGNYNSGDYNSGNYNSGNYNSGNCNNGDYNSGFFNTDEPNVRIFNKETQLKRGDIDIPYISLKVTEWIPEGKMTDEQKKNDPSFHAKKGTLIKRTYKEAWALAWKEMGQETKNKFLNLPNFDAEIFKEITGIDVTEKETCHNKAVEIDGKKYRLVEESEK